MTIKECNKIRAEIFKVYELIKYAEEPKFRNYSLEYYFSELDDTIMELYDESIEEEKKRGQKNDN